MSDRRVIQCFGIKRRPKKEAVPCRKRYMWIASAASRNFGRKGAQACPNCGTAPDFRHPLNRALNGEISEQEAIDLMPKYLEELENKSK